MTEPGQSEIPPPSAESPRPRAVGALARRLQRGAEEIRGKPRVLLVIGAFVFAGLVALCWRDIFITIGPGEGGVLYRRFSGGTETTTVYAEGLHVVAPWNTLYVYDVRGQEMADEFAVLSRDGRAIGLRVSIRCHPVFSRLGLLHRQIGPDYLEKVVKPEVEAEFRTRLGQYRPEEIDGARGFILRQVVQAARARLGERYIQLDDVRLTAIALPAFEKTS